VVLGKAKVINYKDFEKAQAKHAMKKKAIVAKGKGKRGNKCKSLVLDIKAKEEVKAKANLQEEEVGLLVPKNKMAWIGEVELIGALWRALVAKMY